MKKYSVLITTYNRSNSIEKCIDSVLSQTFNDYEIIVLDDKSNDNTLDILKKYKNKIKLLKHDVNKGISVSRNELISEVNTPYFLFLDSDDYFENNLLEICDKYVDNIDLLSFCYKELDSNFNYIRSVLKTNNSLDKGENIISKWILNKCTFDTPVCYIYNTKFFKSNNFQYEEGRNHEDFALTPIIITKANKMISISNELYNVILSDNSIVRNKSSIKKNIYDKIYHYDNLLKYFINSNIKEYNKKIILSFLSNSLINDIERLDGSEKHDYLLELKKRDITKYLLNNSIKRKLKKIFIKTKYNI